MFDFQRLCEEIDDLLVVSKLLGIRLHIIYHFLRVFLLKCNCLKVLIKLRDLRILEVPKVKVLDL